MSYILFDESQRLQRYRQNTKTQKRVHGLLADLVTFYTSVCRCGVKRESWWTPVEDHNAIWCVVGSCMVVEIPWHEHGSPA